MNEGRKDDIKCRSGAKITLLMLVAFMTYIYIAAIFSQNPCGIVVCHLAKIKSKLLVVIL